MQSNILWIIHTITPPVFACLPIIPAAVLQGNRWPLNAPFICSLQDRLDIFIMHPIAATGPFKLCACTVSSPLLPISIIFSSHSGPFKLCMCTVCSLLLSICNKVVKPTIHVSKFSQFSRDWPSFNPCMGRMVYSDDAEVSQYLECVDGRIE